MTVEKARDILGEFARNLSDPEIQAVIDSFNGIIEVGLRQFERKYNVEPSPEAPGNEVTATA